LFALPRNVADAVEGMRGGSVLLRVPLRDDVIQVGTADSLTTATIEVHTAATAVSVRRTDGKPLQAQIVHRRADGGEKLRTVFSEPVARLRLRRLRNLTGPPLWVVTDGVDGVDPAGLAQLVQTIVCFGVAKQRRSGSGPAARPA